MKPQRYPTKTAQAGRRRIRRVVEDMAHQDMTGQAINAYVTGPGSAIVTNRPRVYSMDPALELAQHIRNAMAEPEPGPVTIYDGTGTLVRTASARAERTPRRRRWTQGKPQPHSKCFACGQRSRKAKVLGWLYCCKCGPRLSRMIGASPEQPA